jgi:serine/threonine-protein kinase
MRRTFTRLGLVFYAIPALLAGVRGEARAEGVSDASAASAFAEAGAELMAAGDLPGGCRKLQQATTFDASATRFLALGDCWERAGRTASAWDAYHLAEELAMSGATDIVARAREGTARVEAVLPRLEITPPWGAEFADLELYLDGSRLSPLLYSVAVPVDPGLHELRASAPGRVPFALELTLPSGPGTTRVRIPESSLGRKPVLPEPDPPRAPIREDASEPPGQTLRIVGLALGGVGIASLAIGTGFAVKAGNERSELEAQCPSGICTMAGKDKYDAYTQHATVANAALIAGATSLVGGVIVYLVAPSAHPAKSRHVAVEPLVGPGFSGLSARGAF